MMFRAVVFQTHGTEGSGYEGNSFPHTPQENFKGFTMIDAWEVHIYVGIVTIYHLPSAHSNALKVVQVSA